MLSPSDAEKNPRSRAGWGHRLGLIPRRIWVQLNMYARKLDTRQYADAELLRVERIKVTGQHTIRAILIQPAITTMVTVGLAAWCGSGIAHADNNHEQEACALMDDHATAINLGYTSTPVQYALAVLSTEMPPVDAAHVLLAATRDDCPNHAADLPAGWR